MKRAGHSDSIKESAYPFPEVYCNRVRPPFIITPHPTLNIPVSFRIRRYSFNIPGNLKIAFSLKALASESDPCLFKSPS